MYLTDFRQVYPKYPLEQEAALERLAELHQGESEEDFENILRKLRRLGCKPDSIGTRYSEWDGFLSAPLVDDGDRNPLHTMSDRMSLFKEATDLALKDLLVDHHADHHFHVSCTGYTSPSPVQNLLNREKAFSSPVTHLYHMGCYASLPAVRLAMQVCAQRPVQIVHNELCSLHFRAGDLRPDQLVVQSLFGDAHCRYRILATAPEARSLKFLQIEEQRIANSADDMTWDLTENGFLMTLSRHVPQSIGKHLHDFVANLVDPKLWPQCIFAIHPGGPKIIDSTAQVLGLQAHQTEHSREILRTHGNVSSATLPLIWQSLIEEKEIPRGTPVVSLGFGPGLTLFGAVGEIA